MGRSSADDIGIESEVPGRWWNDSDILQLPKRPHLKRKTTNEGYSEILKPGDGNWYDCRYHLPEIFDNLLALSTRVM